MTSRAKITVLATSYPRHAGDYASVFVHGLSKRLAQHYDVHAVVPHERGLVSEAILDGVCLHRFRYFWPDQLEQVAYGYGIPENLRHKFWARVGLPFFGLGFLIKSLCVARRSSIIHAHWEISALVGIVVGRIYRVPVVLTVHRLVARSWLAKKLTRFLFRHLDALYFNSTYTRDEALRLMDGKLPPHAIIYPSIDINVFKPGTPEVSFRQKFSIDPADTLILGLGRLVEKKGFCDLIDAFAQLTREGMGNIKLIIAGGGPLADSLLAQATKSCPPGSFHFTGFISPLEVQSLLRETQIMVVPSIVDSRGEVETLGTVIMEAQASGVAVIAARVGGIPDVVEDGSTGYLFASRDSSELREKIKQVIADPRERAAIAKQALKRVHEKFAWETAVQATLENYAGLRPR